MGLLVDGQWQDSWYSNGEDGRFEREAAKRRHWIAHPEQPIPSCVERFPPAANRYHLYVSLACPWAHRVLIYRVLKNLEQYLPVSIVSWLMREDGWTFDRELGATGDALYGNRRLYELYQRDQTDYTGRVTVPVLWDSQEERIVNNESADLIRMFNSAFDNLTGNRLDLYPESLRDAIDTLNGVIYPRLNNGVYRAGFATTQTAYEEAFREVFATLDALEARLTTKRYLTGEWLTEADWRLFTTLIRFDAVYHGHFKCNERRIRDYPALSGWLRELYQWPGIAATVDLVHIKRHYYVSHPQLNPTGIVPTGPALDFATPHEREALPGKGIWQRP